MGSLFRSEEVCLVQIFLQSGSAYNCVSELGELGIVEFRDVRELILEKPFFCCLRVLCKCLYLTLTCRWHKEDNDASLFEILISAESKCERVPEEVRERGEEILSLLNSHDPALFHTCSSAPLVSFEPVALAENRQDVRLSFVAGVVHPWKVPAFERLLWRACRGYIIVDFHEMEEKLEHPDSGEEVQWTVFLISFWGDQIGQKVKKICDCFHTETFPYPESQAEREETLNGLRRRIEDIKSVMGETEQYMQQLLVRALARLPEWIVQVQKCKAVQTVLNLCSPSVTDKCLIAEAWCPVSQLPALKSGSSVDSFYNRLPATTSPPTLFPTNAFTAGFQNIVDAYGVACYREMNPAVYTIITFPFLFAVMFGDVGHGLLMTLLALWMVLEEKDSKLRKNTNEIWQMMFGGRYLILLMGLFSIYTGAIYNECFSRGLNTFSSGWHIRPNAEYYNWTEETFKSNQYLSLDPNVTGVFTGPYPFGVDPIWGLANNHLTFLNSYKMKMSVIIGVIHMTFGVCLSLFNYIHFRDISSVFLVLIPELCFMLCLFGYLIFMVIYKWVVYGPMTSDSAPSILIHFIDMFLFTENKDNKPLYTGQMVVQKVLVIVAVLSVPVLLLGKPMQEYITHRRQRTPLSVSNPSEFIYFSDWEWTHIQFFSNVFMHQAIHTIEYCLGCISNTASYLRLWALSLAHAQLSEVLWLMVMRISFQQLSYVGSVIMVVIFAAFAVLTVSILLVMEGLSAFLHALRLHWVEFQNKFYSGTGYKLTPFAFTSEIGAFSLK
uniref:V-type proton ATPase subunit a n=1 Tax=Sinocyclocheilus anshuiensis TaxID=1608454 RepID=A0A671L828_9TELE